MAINEDDVVAEVRAVLRTADPKTITERMIVQEVSRRLAPRDTSQYLKTIQKEVTDYVMEQAQTLAGKRSRDGEDPTAPEQAAKPCKVAKPADDAELDVPLSDDGLLRARVRTFKGKTYVDLRAFWQKDGVAKPGKKGIMLTVEDWRMLSVAFPLLGSSLEAADTSASVQLSGLRRATISDFRKDVLAVDVREWYDKEGELKPGQKGASLPSESFKTLVTHKQAIDAALGPATAPSASAGTASGSGAAEATPEAAPKASNEPTAAEPTGGASGDPPGLHRLGTSTKFASISTFNGQKMVSLREHYNKENQWLPGKKGISLQLDQFATLKKHSEAITVALADKNTGFEVPLSDKRAVSISLFNGKYLVNVREYYDKGGSRAPSAKGLAMNTEQWAALVKALPALSAQC